MKGATLVALVAAAVALTAGHLRAAHPADAAFEADSWSLLYERPAVGKYEDFAFPDTINGWLVSASGFILHTADGGLTWAEQAKGMPGLRSIDFIDARRGFAGTLTGKLFATTDGGTTWTDIAPTLPHIAIGFCGMTHVGDQVHVVGRYNGAAADYFFSPDGGKTWKYTNLRDVAQGLVDVSFINKNLGFIGGMGKSATEGQSSAIILRTTDGGKSWRRVFEHSGGRGFAWKIFPINAKLLYASLQSEDGVYRIAKSTDAGEHWDTLTVATAKPMGHNIQGIGFMDANTGFVGGFFGGMFATIDGGKSWHEVPLKSAGILNRFEKVGHKLITASARGVLRYDGVTRTHAGNTSPD